MTKKPKSKSAKSKNVKNISAAGTPATPEQLGGMPGGQDISKLPKEAQDRLKKIKEQLDKFSKQVVEKFDKYVVGIALLPPAKQQQHASMQNPNEEISDEMEDIKKEKPNPDDVNILVLIDDNDSQKMTKQELKDKLSVIILKIAEDIDKKLKPQTVILSELWQSCYDAKYDYLQEIAMSAPVYDNGMLAAIKISEIHKSMVLKKFEKYIVSYVLAGSIVRGQATKTSDIDVWIVIDDTDVKKMTRAELKDKLRAIIIGMGYEAGQITGIQNKINIQVYILTDFWDSLKEANPIIFTLLRDGVPFFDRGIFMPWKQLLKMGKIKPSAEAIDMFMQSGEQMIKRVEFKIKEIGMEDIYYALLTPSQAALMMYGIAPPAPRETANLMKEIFVKKEKLFDTKTVDILDHVIKVRKELEHGTMKELKGAEIDKMLDDASDYLKKIKTLFDDIEKRKEEEDVVHIYETIVTLVRDALTLEGVKSVKNEELLKHFEERLISQGKMPEKYKRMLEDIIKAKKDYDDKNLTKTDVEKTKKDSREVIKFVIEYIQRKKGRELERAKIRVKHGEKYGEVLMLDKVAFVIHDLDNQESGISIADIDKDGSLQNLKSSTLEELEKHIAKIEIPNKVFLKQKVFENLKNIFGKDVEILMNY
ncbi:nucleotidyltransferase domain-containing protein [Candidatus Woesearchaeota archaeon]|nr:nucleotidyltransferase domain-containing protein [Candidatus Woesearchaeota archaeon]